MPRIHSSVSSLEKTFERWKDHIDYIPDDQKRRYAKIAYNVARRTVSLVQSAIYLPFRTLKRIGVLLGVAKSMMGRVFFKATQIPTYAKKHFFPSPEQILERRIKDLDFQLTHKTVQHTLRNERGRELFHDEKTELMHKWIDGCSNFERQSEIERLRFLLNEIADGDLPNDVLDKLKEEAGKIASDLHRKVRGVQSFVRTFIASFESEGKKIFSESMDPLILLHFPHLLKTKEAEAFIAALSAGALKNRLEQKLLEVNMRVMKKRHGEEMRTLNELSELLRPVDLDAVKKRYINAAEAGYLTSRLQGIESEIQAISKTAKKGQKSFKHHMLELEKRHLKKQQEQMRDAESVVLGVENRGEVEKANEVNGRALKALDGIFKTQLSERIAALKAKSLLDGKVLAGLDETLSQLSCPSPGEPIEPYFNKIELLYKTLQKIESDLLKKIPKKNDYINKCSIAHAGLQAEWLKIEKLHQTDPWKCLNLILPYAKRKEERQKALANDLICLSLEMRQSGDCLLALKLAKKDSPSHGIKAASTSATSLSSLSRIQKCSESFVAAVVEQNLAQFVTELDSLEEFIAAIEEGSAIDILNPVRQTAQQERNFPFEKLSLSINPRSELALWGSRLQKIWQDSMPQEDREVILKAPKKELEELMKQSFDRWLVRQTGYKFPFDLSFRGFLVEDLSEDRAAACETIARKGRNRLTKKRLKPVTPSPVAPSSGFATGLIEKFDHKNEIASCRLDTTPYEGSQGKIDLLSNNVIDLLAKTIERLKSQYSDLSDQTVALTEAIAADRRFDGIQDKHLIIRRNCLEIAEKVPRAITIRLIGTFLDTYRDASSQLQLTTIDNTSRAWFLSTYLKMITAMKSPPLMVTETERRFCVQMCQLSDLSTQDKETLLASLSVDASVLPSLPFMTEVGESLQKSPVTLEGIDESVLQRSFQEMNKNTPEQRALLDRLQKRSGSEDGLLEALFQDASDLAQIEKREMFSRALFHAFKNEKDKIKAYLQGKINALSAAQRGLIIDPKTMTPSVATFLSDLFLEIDPTDGPLNTMHKTFNESLIASNDAHQMLMGYAREITRVTRFWMASGEISDEDFGRLLKCKMGYQSLKKEHFNGKRALSGFVEMAVMKAETTMMTSMSEIDRKMQDGAWLQNLLPHFTKRLIDPDAPCHADGNWVERFQKRQAGDVFKAHKDIPGMICFGARLQIDALLGTCYLNGEQHVQLSPHSLQNDPTLRLLGLNSLPYMKDSLGAFCYVTEEKGNKIAQVKVIYQPTTHSVIIQKRLPVSFKSRTPELLQYIPREEIELPFVIEHRLQVKHFWKNSVGDIFGYDADGELMTIIKVGAASVEVFTREQDDPFVFISRSDIQSSRVPLNYLLSCFSPNDILFDPKNNMYWVPGADLKLILNPDNVTWKCSGRGVSSLVLDTDVPPCAYIPLRQNEQKKKAADIRNRIRVAKEKLAEALQENPNPSLIDRDDIEKLKKRITDLEKNLSEVLGKVCFTTLAEKAFDKRETYSVLVGIQSQIQSYSILNETISYLLDNVVDALPSDVYRIALKEIKGSLQELQRDMDSPANSKEIQKKYLELEKIYSVIAEAYEKDCTKMMERTLFHMSATLSISSENLSAALILCTNALRTRQLMTVSIEMMKEFSKYALTGPLSDNQYRLLSSILEALELEDSNSQTDLQQLRLYLLFMQYRHFAFKVEELSHMPLKNQQAYVAEISTKVEACKKQCETLCGKIENLPSPIQPELLDVWKRSSLAQNVLDRVSKEVPVLNLMNSKAVGFLQSELGILSRQNLLERIDATESIASTPKVMAQELSLEQKTLVKHFRLHSPREVEGFFLEEMGRFNAGTLFAEFDVESDKGGLFSTTKEDIQLIFDRMSERGWIVRRSNESYYSLATPSLAMDKFDRNVIEPVLVGKGYTEDEINKIIERLQTFLFRSMQSGYTFSFVAKQSMHEIEERLFIEKEKHRLKYLEAESALKVAIAPYGLHITDLKYAFLSDDGSQLPKELQEKYDFLRNALSRYLFHKSEVQHIENVEKAPFCGERNKIELLQTRRNYSIDLILKESATGDEREEQIMQKAFLVFEEDYGNRCNAMQIRMFRSLLRTPGHRESVDAAQARMGFGKTALLPLMAIVRVALERTAQDKHLVRYVVPKAVIEDNSSSFNEKLRKVLGRNVVKDREFSRYQIDEEAKKDSLKLILDDLNSRLSLYIQARDRGDVLIQWPEIRGSMEAQELDFAQLLIEEKMDDEEKALCMACKTTLAQIRSLSTYTVFDELDETQDIKSREVNYTRGDKKPILKASIRPLEQIVACIENAPHDFSDLQRGAVELLQAVGLHRLSRNNALIDYLTHRSASIDPVLQTVELPLQNWLRECSKGKEVNSEEAASLFLIRAVLLDPNMLSLARSKQPNTHFGARFEERGGKRVYFKDPDSSAALLIAVPYEGTNTPKGLSIFDNTEVAAITTLRYYASPETSLSQNPHLDFLLAQTKKGSLDEVLSKHYLGRLVNAQGKSPLEKLKEMSELLDEEELKQAKESFFNDFMKDPKPQFRKFFAVAVVTTQIRSDAACTKSDRYEKGSQQSIEKGCSGTVGGTSSYFEQQATDPAADGGLSLGIMGRSNNKEVKVLTPPNAQGDYLQQILTTLLVSANPSTKAIVDAAGICKSRDGTPETVVIELWKLLKQDPRFNEIDGIIYYGKDGVKRLYKGSQHFSCDTAKELEALKEGKKYFSFYGQKNTRGSDIKQADGAHALVTIDENVSNSDAKQAVLRFRKLVNKDSLQTFSFAVMPSFVDIVKQRLQNEVRFRIAKEEAAIRLATDEESRAKDEINTSQDKDVVAKATEKMRKARSEIVASNALITQLRGQITPAAMGAMPVEAKEVAQYLRLRERDVEEKASLMIFRKEMAAHVKQAAAHLEHAVLLNVDLSQAKAKKAYIDFLKAREKIVAFSVKAPDSLFAKYGTASEDQNRDAFIAEQMQKANESIDALFEITRTFSRSTLSQDVALDRAFYTSHIERSAHFFKNRFGEETAIQITAVDSDAQAIAEALAEAQAMAEAVSEALAENISVRVVQEPPAAVVPQLKMSNTVYNRYISLDFLSHRSFCALISDFEPLKHLVLKSERDKFFVSPHLQIATPLAPHFVIKQGNECIFISHEEADLLRKAQKKGGCPQVQRDAELYCAHTFKAISHSTKALSNVEMSQIRCVVLGNNGIDKVPPLGGLTTEKLRSITLENVTSDQLLPHLTVTQTPEASAHFMLNRFGLKGQTNVVIDSKRSPQGAVEILVTAEDLNTPGSSQVSSVASFNTHNKYFKEVMSEAFDPTITRNKRLQFANEAIQRREEDYLRQKRELEVKTRELEANRKRLTDLVASVKTFEVTAGMKAGLDERDRERFNNYGKSFMAILDDIDIQRNAFVSIVSGNPVDTLNIDKKAKIEAAIKSAETQADPVSGIAPAEIVANEIKKLFDTFISDDVLKVAVELKQKSQSFSSKLLITVDEWNRTDRVGRFASADPGTPSTWKPFDLVYGRIVHDVHNSDCLGAARCGRPDCKEMFATTLPALVAAVTHFSPENLKDVYTKVPAIKEDLQKIANEIAALEAEVKLLPDAKEKILALLEVQTKIERDLASQGIRFSESGEFFDLFALGKCYGTEDWKDFSVNIQGASPEYLSLCANMEASSRAIAALTATETDVLRKNKALGVKVNELAWQLEERSREIEVNP